MTNTTPCKNKTRTWKNKSVYDIDMNQISLDNAAVIVLEHIKVYGLKKNRNETNRKQQQQIPRGWESQSLPSDCRKKIF